MNIRSWIGAASAMALLTAAPLATAHDTDAEKGTRTSQSFDYRDFDKIEIEGVYEVRVTVGPAYGIDVSGKAKRMKKIEVAQRGDTLVLGTKKGRKWRGKNNGVKAVITLPTLNGIALEGVGSVEADGIDSPDFTASLAGVGSMELAGTCGKLHGSVEGIGSLETRKLKCADVIVSVEGMGSADVYASQSVEADIDGMGSIDVIGSPKSIKKSKGFMSSIDVN